MYKTEGKDANRYWEIVKRNHMEGGTTLSVELPNRGAHIAIKNDNTQKGEKARSIYCGGTFSCSSE